MNSAYTIHKSNGAEFLVEERSGQLQLAVDDDVAGWVDGNFGPPEEMVVAAMKLLAAASYYMDEAEFEAAAGISLNEVYRRSNV